MAKIREPNAEPTPPPASWPTVLGILAVLAGAVFRVWGLDSRPLWLDEAFSHLYATLPWSEVIELRRTGTNPPLYHLLLSGWVALFGRSAGALRSLSVLFGVGSIGLMWVLARRLVGPRPAAVATALLAVSSLSIAYAQEARFYALTQFLALLGSWLLCRMLDRLRRVDALWYVVAMALLVWTHTFGWFVLAAHAVWLIAAACECRDADPRRRRILALGAVSGSAIVLSFSPWLPIFFEQIAGVRRGYWISEPPWSRLLACLHDMLVLDRLMRWPAVVLAGLIGLFAVIRALRHQGNPAPLGSAPRSGIPLRSPDLWGLVAWMVLPILVPFAWSKLSTPIFQIKYAIVAQAPALILLAAVAVRRPLLVATALALLTVCWPPNPDRGLIVEDWPAVAHLLREQADPGSTVFVYRDYGYFPLDYYLGDGWRLTPVFANGHTTTAFAPYYPEGGITFAELTRWLAASGERDAWLVLRWESPRRREALVDRLGRFRDVQAMHRFRGLDVVQFQRR